MKLDDRDIVCETDYSPLSNEELAAQIEWHASAMSGATAYDLERITGPARALMARVEAADARAEQFRRDYNGLYDDYHEMRHRLADIGAMLRAARQRVAELESQLAAQGWRPVTEKPPADDEYLVWCSSYAGCEIQSYSKRLNRWYGNTGNDADYWQPLPPAPQETE